MIDIANELKAIHRAVTTRTIDDGEVVGVLLRRSYDATAEDVWDAMTDPERVRRWFLPLTGELRVGGTFSLEGNMSGDILECDPPRRLKLIWGGPGSVVELRLTPGSGEDTVLELEHTVPLEMAGSGAGALYVGPGWDGAFLGLGLFLAGVEADDPVAAANSPEAQEFSRQSVGEWVAAIEESGAASEAEVAAAKAASLAHFAPDAG